MDAAHECQIDLQEQFSSLKRPTFLCGPSGLLHRLGEPRRLAAGFLRCLRTEGWRPTLRKTARWFGELAGIAKPAARTGSPLKAVPLNLRPGDLVEVISMDEILQTLDADGKNRGLLFTSEMRAFCGRRFRVFKRLEGLYNEYTRQMRKVSHTVLLEGVYCQGIGCGCDRACFHFWREAWLRRICESDGEPLI